MDLGRAQGVDAAGGDVEKLLMILKIGDIIRRTQVRMAGRALKAHKIVQSSQFRLIVPSGTKALVLDLVLRFNPENKAVGLTTIL